MASRPSSSSFKRAPGAAAPPRVPAASTVGGSVTGRPLPHSQSASSQSSTTRTSQSASPAPINATLRRNSVGSTIPSAGGDAVSGTAPAPASQLRIAASSAPAHAERLPGTRRWVDGGLLVSTGHSELDSILGGGVALGSMVLIEEDAHASASECVLAHMIAEGIACGQGTVLGLLDGESDEPFTHHLPMNVSRDSRDIAAARAVADGTASAPAHTRAGEHAMGSTTNVEAGEDGASRGTAATPVIASAEPVKYCHTFDLSRHVHAHTIRDAAIATVRACACIRVCTCGRLGRDAPSVHRARRRSSASGSALDAHTGLRLPTGRTPQRDAAVKVTPSAVLASFLSELHSALMAQADAAAKVCRVVLPGFGSAGWPGGCNGDAVGSLGMLMAAGAACFRGSGGGSSSGSSGGVGGVAPDALHPFRGRDADALAAAADPRAERAHTALLLFLTALRSIISPSVVRSKVGSAATPMVAATGATPRAVSPAVPPTSEAGRASPAATNVGSVSQVSTSARSPSPAAVLSATPPGVPAARESSLRQPAVCVISMPLHLYPPAVAAAIRGLFDVVIKLHAFSDPWYALIHPTRVAGALPGTPMPLTAPALALASAAGTAPEFAEYQGLLLVRKLPRHILDTLTFCYKRDRKKFTVERPHLPPEGQAPAPAAPTRVAGGAPRPGTALRHVPAARTATDPRDASYAVSADSDEIDAVVSMPEEAAPSRLACATTGGNSSLSALDF